MAKSPAPTATVMASSAMQVTSVRDAPFNAKGDGDADDTDAVQRAVDWTQDRARGHIHFPIGRYKLTRPVTWERPECDIGFLGEPGAEIFGDFPDWLLLRSMKSPIGGVHTIEKLRFQNHHPKGKGVAFHSCVGASIENCYISCNRPLETYNSQSIKVDTCSIICPGQSSADSVGIMAGNSTYVYNTDVTGFTHGIRHQNLGLVVYGGRMEVNDHAIYIGMNQNGEVWQSNGFDIAGVSMESNNVGVFVHAGAAGAIRGMAISCNVEGKKAGVYVHDGEQIAIQAVSVSNGFAFSDAGIFLNNPKRSTFSALRINVKSGKAWHTPPKSEWAERQLEFSPSCTPEPG